MVDRTYTEKVKIYKSAIYQFKCDMKAKEIFNYKWIIAIFIDFFGRLQRKLEVFCSAAKIMITKSVEEQ